MAKKNRPPISSTIDCACVIHGDAYSWIYVDRLYNMLKANLSHEIRLHVFTESKRSVPAPYIKHDLQEWPGVAGPRKSWWYKMQMFDSRHFAGRMLYFDLDTVITKNLDWMWKDFETKNINATVKLHHGDQDYLNSVLPPEDLRFFDVNTIKSWRWQCKDGGYNMIKRQYNRPDIGTTVDPATAVMVFHGHPKPHQIQDSVVERYWTIDTK